MNKLTQDVIEEYLNWPYVYNIDPIGGDTITFAECTVQVEDFPAAGAYRFNIYFKGNTIPSYTARGSNDKIHIKLMNIVRKYE